MKILFITIAFAPTEFSESIVNSKLVLAFKNAGYQVDVISRSNQGVAYSTTWNEPWLSLKTNTHEIDYKLGNKWERLIDTFICSVKLKYPLEGVRWASRAYDFANKLIESNKYDVIMTRSPSDISHLIGLKLYKKHKIKWIANWNDPSNGIMPLPYKNSNNVLNNIISRYYTKKALKNASFSTFPSDRLQNYFTKFFKINIKNSFIIPHIGLDLIDLSNNIENDKSTISICHAGSLSSERNPEILLKNIAKLNLESSSLKFKLTIIGIANEQLNYLINKYNLENFVFFEKSKSYLETLNYMKLFDVLCVIEAKIDEGIFLPSKFIDYVSLKKPILCFSPLNGTLADTIKKYDGGIVIDNQDNDSVYNGLKHLMNLKEENSLYKITSNNAIRNYFDEKTIVDKYKNVFNQQ
jgi:glycosyltransferase involved in cell wall biosynthesis